MASSDIWAEAEHVVASRGQVLRHAVRVMGRSQWPGSEGHDAQFFNNDSILAATDTAFYVIGSRGSGGRNSRQPSVTAFQFSEMTHVSAADDSDGLPSVIRFTHDPQRVDLMDVHKEPGWNDLVQFWARTMNGPAGRELLLGAPSQSRWENLVRPYPVDPGHLPKFVFVEHLRENLEVSDFQSCQQAAEWLMANYGSGYEGVLRDQNGQRVSPSYLSVADGWIDPESGDCVMSAVPAHRALGLPDVLDLGARDGRNMSRWADQAPAGMVFPNHQPMLGDATTGIFEMGPVAADVISIDVSPDGHHCAIIEHYESPNTHALSMLDRRTGLRTLVTGSPTPLALPAVRFSPDSRWLLVTSMKPWLVRVQDGLVAPIPVDFSGSCVEWWTPDPSQLAFIDTDRQAGTSIFRRLDLRDMTWFEDGLVRVPGMDQLPPSRRFLASLAIAPDGESALMTTSVGPSAEYQNEHGSRMRLARLDLRSLEVEPLFAPFVGSGEVLERDHSHPRWLERSPTRPTDVGDGILAASRQPVPIRGLDPESWGRDSMATTQLLLLGAVNKSTPHIVRPEALRHLRAARDFAPQLYDEDRPWFTALAEDAAAVAAKRTFDAKTTDSWAKIARGIRAIDAGQEDDIDWLSDAFVGPPPQSAPRLQPRTTATDRQPPGGRSYPVPEGLVAQYTFVERVHPDMVGVDAFIETNQAADWLAEHHGVGFTGRLLTDQRELLSPDWLDVSGGWVDPRSRACVVSGTVAQSSLGLGPAYDVGAWDGRNWAVGDDDWGPRRDEARFAPERQLWFGDGEQFLPAKFGIDVQQFAVSPDGSQILTIEGSASEPARVYIGPVAFDQPRRYLGTFEGARDPRFSGDGRWVALDARGLILIDVATGEYRKTAWPYGIRSGWDWWPDKPGKLVAVRWDDDRKVNVLAMIDGATGSEEEIGLVSVDGHGNGETPSADDLLQQPSLSPDGRWLLATSRAWMHPRRDSDFSPRHGLVRVDMQSLAAEPVFDSFVDGMDRPFPPNSLTLDHADVRWIGTLGGAIPDAWTSVSPETPAPEAANPICPEEIADDARSVVTLAVEQARGMHPYTGSGLRVLLPEVVRAAAALRDHDAGWPAQRDSLKKVAEASLRPGAAADDAARGAWAALGGAVDLINDHRDADLDWHTLESPPPRPAATIRPRVTRKTSAAPGPSVAAPPRPPAPVPSQASGEFTAGRSQSAGTGKRRLLVGLLAAAAVVVVIILAGGQGSGPSTAVPQAADAGSEGADAAAETGIEGESSVPDGFEPCPNSVSGEVEVYVNGVTSCSFADNVARAWFDAPGSDVLVAIDSPTTGRAYDMTCSGEGPVLCEGGDDAQVLILVGATGFEAGAAPPDSVTSASVAEGLTDTEAERQLDTLAATGAAELQRLPEGIWVPQVSSKCAALSEVDYTDDAGSIGWSDGRTESFSAGIGDPRILAFHLGLRERLEPAGSDLVLVKPQDLGIDSNYRDLCGQSTMWISLDLSQRYTSSEAALEFCDESGLPFGECAARLVASDTRIELPLGDQPNPGDPNTYPVLVDTYLAVRDGPFTDATEIGRVPAGGYVTIVCTVEGDAVRDPFGDTISLWDRIDRPFEGYVSDAFVDTGGTPPRAPRC